MQAFALLVHVQIISNKVINFFFFLFSPPKLQALQFPSMIFIIYLTFILPPPKPFSLQITYFIGYLLLLNLLHLNLVD